MHRAIRGLFPFGCFLPTTLGYLGMKLLLGVLPTLGYSFLDLDKNQNLEGPSSVVEIHTRSTLLAMDSSAEDTLAVSEGDPMLLVGFDMGLAVQSSGCTGWSGVPYEASRILRR